MQETTNKYKVFFDISETATPDYSEFKPISIAFDSGETMDTWYDMLSKFANNVKVALDPKWGITAKFDATDPVAQFIMSKEFAVGRETTCGVKIINLLKGTSGKQINFIATVSGIKYTAETKAVLEISFDLKIFNNTTFTETDYVLSI